MVVRWPGTTNDVPDSWSQGAILESLKLSMNPWKKMGRSKKSSVAPDLPPRFTHACNDGSSAPTGAWKSPMEREIFTRVNVYKARPRLIKSGSEIGIAKDVVLMRVMGDDGIGGREAKEVCARSDVGGYHRPLVQRQQQVGAGQEVIDSP